MLICNMILKVVDIGSNSVKASLYSVENQTYKALEKFKLALSLGEQVFSKGHISDEAIDKIAHFIKNLPQEKSGEKVHFTFIVATSAVRSATNREMFVKKLQQKTDLQVRVLSGEEESFLIHMGIVHKVNPTPDEIIKTIDIGGGSVELSWSKGEQYLDGHSFDLGAIRLTENFPQGKIFTRETIKAISDWTTKELTSLKAKPPTATRAIGSSGNIRAIFKMVQALHSPAFLKLMPEITIGSIETLLEFSIGKSPQQLNAIFEIGPERANIIVSALCVLNICMRHFQMTRLSISESGLREGVVYYWSRHGHLTFPSVSF